MSRNHKEGYAQKHPETTVLEDRIATALKDVVEDNQISCAAAHRIAEDLGRPAADIGLALDLMEVRLMRCQLGLFGYTPHKRIVKEANDWDKELEAEIRDALRDDRLPCKDAWSIADRRQIKRLTVANICEALGIKIRPCQLGAF